MWLCDSLTFNYQNSEDWGFFRWSTPFESKTCVCWSLPEEGEVLWGRWMDTDCKEDPAISGVLADWLDDHRDSLLDGAVGPDPKGRLDLLIRWLREVRCWGNESVSV